MASPEAAVFIATDDLTADVILARALKLEPRQMDRAQQTTVGMIMHRLGWERGRQGAGDRAKVYRRPTVKAGRT